MLSSVLRSERAVQVNITIMRASYGCVPFYPNIKNFEKRLVN